VTPQVGEPAGLVEALAAALSGAEVAAVLLRVAATDERTMVNGVKAIAPTVQNKETALLLDGHENLVAKSGADGAHLTGVDALQAALATLKPDRIAGCGGLATRHDAMVAGEAGADYVMFGEPDAGGGRPSFDSILERVQWWAEVFEVPCVGYAATLDEVAALAAAGADFVAVGDFIFSDPRGAAVAMSEAAQRLVALEMTA
jgi:thiamine-phosphate pyrophosphorylase